MHGNSLSSHPLLEEATDMYVPLLLLIIIYPCPAHPLMIRPWLTASLAWALAVSGLVSASAWDLQNVTGHFCGNSHHPSLKRFLSQRRTNPGHIFSSQLHCLLPSAFFSFRALTVSAAKIWFFKKKKNIFCCHFYHLTCFWAKPGGFRVLQVL